jgi:hypothetical protein
MHRADPAMGQTPVAIRHLVTDIAGREHRMLAGPPLAAVVEPFGDAALASGQFM